MKRLKNLLRICLPLLYACLLAMIFNISVVSSPLAQAHPAKLGPISVENVYTADENQNNNSSFAAGDKINYRVDVDNNTSTQFPIDVQFEVFENGADLNAYSYNNTIHVDQMPTGLSRFYTSTTIPTKNASGQYIASGEYTIRISIVPTNGVLDPANDGDWGEGTFTVVSPNDNASMDKQIQTLQNGAMCAGDVVSLGTDDLLLTSVQTAVSAEGYFQDRQTGTLYSALVKLVPGSSCIELIGNLKSMSS